MSGTNPTDPRQSSDPGANDDLGLAAVDRAFHDMAIDQQWSVREARGFTWWGAWVRERIWADEAVRSDGETLWQVRARTAAYRDQPDEPATYAFLESLNGLAGLNAYTYDPDDRTVSARCGTFLYEAVSPWLERFLIYAVALQPSIAWLQVPDQADGRPLDDAPHPTSGPRHDPDDMLNVASSVPAATSPFTPDVLRAAAATLGTEGWTTSCEGPGELLQALVPMSPDVPAPWGLAASQHPILGPGAFVRLAIPGRHGPTRAAWLANSLNLGETADWRGERRPHALGAWTSDEGTLVHSAFFPAVLLGDVDDDGALVAIRNFLAWGTVRAQYAAERLPWLETAARSRYPDDEPQDLDVDASDAAIEAPEPTEQVTDWRSITTAGPAARPPRSPRDPTLPASARRELVVDPSTPGAFAEIDDAVADADDGDLVRVRPGLYRKPVMVDRAVAIEGDGDVTAIVLEPSGGEALAFFASGGRVENLTIRPAAAGNDGATWSAVWVRDVIAEIERCDLSSHLGATVAVIGPSSRAHVLGCFIHDGAENGVSVSSEGSATIDVTDITDSRWPGILVRGAHTSAVVRDSTVHDNRDWGIVGDSDATLVVERTMVARNAVGGIALQGAAPASRTEDCDVTENSDVGILIRGGRGGLVIGNRVSRNGAGIVAAEGASPTIQGNDIAGNVGPGIGVHMAGTDPIVRENDVAAGGSVGIGVSDGAKGRFERNRVTAAEEPGIGVLGAGTTAVFIDNTVTGGSSVGIAVNLGAAGTFTGNDLRGNAGGSWALDGAGTVKLAGNLEDAGPAPGSTTPSGTSGRLN